MHTYQYRCRLFTSFERQNRYFARARTVVLELYCVALLLLARLVMVLCNCSVGTYMVLYTTSALLVHNYFDLYWVFAKIRYTWPLFGQNQLHSENKYKTHPRSPAIG